MKEKNNFARVVDWLLYNGKAKDQKELADMIGITEATMTRNKNGNVRSISEGTIRKLYKKFGDVINVDYLRGTSDVMLVADLEQYSTTEKIPETEQVMDVVIAAKDDIIAALKRELVTKDETTAALRNQLADKERYILSLQQQLSNLQK